MRPLIVLPTYKEAANIAPLLRQIRAAVPSADVLVVDDASPDGTADLAEEIGAEMSGIHVMRRPRKNGLGSAYRCRRTLSRHGNRYAVFMLRLPLTDATSGFRAYRASMLADLPLATMRANGYGFQVEMAYRMAAESFKVVEIPISFTDRTRGQSKMSSWIVLEAMALVTWWGIRDRLRPHRRPVTVTTTRFAERKA
ncbi:MAG TPA: glycosyltransferase [Acidimicrobiales bacterium]